MTYLVTGATGFIGKRLMERMLEREGTIRVLVREQSRDKVAALWPGDRVVPVVGDLAAPMLGLDPSALTGVQHVFHLAALYDMTASAKMFSTSPTFWPLGSTMWKAWPSRSGRWAMWSIASAT